MIGNVKEGMVGRSDGGVFGGTVGRGRERSATQRHPSCANLGVVVWRRIRRGAAETLGITGHALANAITRF